MTFRHLTLLAIAALVLVLGAGFLANQRWVVRNLRYEAAEAERKRQSDPLVLFGSSLTAVALEVPRTVRGTVYVPARMKRSCCGPLCEGDVEAEFAELSGEASGETRSLGALEVIGPKIVIRRPALQHVADRRQHGGRDRHNRLAGAPTRFEPLKQRMRVAGLDPRRTPGALHQDSLEPGSAGPEPGGAALARTLVVLRAQPGPGDQVSGPGKAAHVQPNLGDHDRG